MLNSYFERDQDQCGIVLLRQNKPNPRDIAVTSASALLMIIQSILVLAWVIIYKETRA